MATSDIQRHIRFSALQFELGKMKAQSLGMSFNKFIKYLLEKEIEPLSEFANVKVVKPKQKTTQEMIDEDLKMIEEMVERSRNSPYDPDEELPY